MGYCCGHCSPFLRALFGPGLTCPRNPDVLSASAGELDMDGLHDMMDFMDAFTLSASAERGRVSSGF